jgi:Protein of unknown function (DUF1385)
MGSDRVPDLLAHADRTGAAPRLGGMARPNGVVIVSERFWAFAGEDGSLREGAMPARRARAARVPLLRGLLRIGGSLAPLLRRGGVAGRKERGFLLAAIAAPLLFLAVPAGLRFAAGLALSVAVVAWMLRGRTLRLHGAEHRAIAAAEQRTLRATWLGHVRPSRFSPRCGTNVAALAAPVTLALERAWPLAPAPWVPVVAAVLGLGLTMEVWHAVQQPHGRILRPLLLPGLALQRLTTREPRLEDTRVALRAVESVLRRELATGTPAQGADAPATAS